LPDLNLSGPDRDQQMMNRFSPKAVRRALLGVTAAIVLVATPATADAQGFFQSLFRAFSRPAVRVAPPQQPFIYGDETPGPRSGPDTAMTSGGTGGAFCVRSCDGRYFPVPSSAGQSRAGLCNQFCPASPTVVVYGSNIDHARTAEGRAYASLPNAFRYRTEMVAGCSCNGKDGLGLAQVDINNDRTLRKGDIVVGASGPLVATGRTSKTGEQLSSTNVPQSVRDSFARMNDSEAR
jgi:hypothetical protein